jgi:hypothetical protein
MIYTIAGKSCQEKNSSLFETLELIQTLQHGGQLGRNQGGSISLIKLHTVILLAHSAEFRAKLLNFALKAVTLLF